MMNISMRNISILDFLTEYGVTEEEAMTWAPQFSLLHHEEYKNNTPIFFTEEGKYVVLFPLPFLCGTKIGPGNVLDLQIKNISQLVGTAETCSIDREPHSFYQWSKIVPFIAVIDGKLCAEEKNGGMLARVFGYAGHTYEHRLLDSDIGCYTIDSMVYYRSRNLQDLLANAPVFLRSKTPELIRAMDVESFNCPIADFRALLVRVKLRPQNPEVRQLLASSQESNVRWGVLKLIGEQHFLDKSREDRLCNWVYRLDNRNVSGLAEILCPA